MQPNDSATAKPGLAYVALCSRDAARTAAFLGEDLQLPAFTCETPTDDSALAFKVGETALIVFPQGHAFLSGGEVGVDHIALAADDPVKASDTTALSHRQGVMPGLNGSPQVALDRASTCGVNTRYTNAVILPADTSPLVERLDHIGIASSNNRLAETTFCGNIGAIYESRQTDMEVSTSIESFTSDKYGAVYHSRQPKPVGGLRVSFLSVGDLELEFLEDFDPSQGFDLSQGLAGTTKQDQSAIVRFTKKRGQGLHHIAFKVPDIDAMLARMGAHGHRLIDTIGRPGSRRARIGFIHPSTTGGLLFHFVERTEGAAF